jgi:hypothetical protein
MTKKVIEKVEVDTAYVGLFNRLLKGTQSESVALGILQEMAKDRRCAQMTIARQSSGGWKHNPYPSDDRVTEKQLWKLKQLGVEVSDSLTKHEASTLIEEHMATAV